MNFANFEKLTNFKSNKSNKIEPFNDIKKSSSKIYELDNDTRGEKDILRGQLYRLLLKLHDNKFNYVNEKIEEVDQEIDKYIKKGRYNHVLTLLEILIEEITKVVEINEKYKDRKKAWKKSKRTRTKPHPPSYSNEGRAGSPKKTKSKKTKSKSKKYTLNMWNPNHIRQYLKAHNILNEITRSQNSNAFFKLSLQDVKPKYRAIIFRILARQDKKNRKI